MRALSWHIRVRVQLEEILLTQIVCCPAKERAVINTLTEHSSKRYALVLSMPLLRKIG